MADLRAEVETSWMQDARADEEPPEDEVVALKARAKAFAEDLAAQGSEGAPDLRLRALLQYAERLALAPGAMDASHVEALREQGLDDRAVHDAAQVTAYFSYINRIADGLGVDLEPEMG